MLKVLWSHLLNRKRGITFLSLQTDGEEEEKEELGRKLSIELKKAESGLSLRHPQHFQATVHFPLSSAVD